MSQENEVELVEHGAEDAMNLDQLSIQSLRKYAALYRITLPKDATKAGIIEIIKAKRNSQDMAVVVEDTSGRPKPGWTRMHLHRDPMPGAQNNPVFVGANGYNVTIPRGVDVDVPDKVISVLNDAVEYRLVENLNEPINSPNRWEYKPVLSYPFSVLDRNPGPDPRPGFEKGKAATMGPRIKFKELFGRWPSHAELLEAQKEGLLKINMKEMISKSAEEDARLGGS